MDPLKMYFLLKMGIFHCYVSLLEGNLILTNRGVVWIWMVVKGHKAWRNWSKWTQGSKLPSNSGRPKHSQAPRILLPNFQIFFHPYQNEKNKTPFLSFFFCTPRIVFVSKRLGLYVALPSFYRGLKPHLDGFRLQCSRNLVEHYRAESRRQKRPTKKTIQEGKTKIFVGEQGFWGILFWVVFFFGRQMWGSVFFSEVKMQEKTNIWSEWEWNKNWSNLGLIQVGVHWVQEPLLWGFPERQKNWRDVFFGVKSSEFPRSH